MDAVFNIKQQETLQSNQLPTGFFLQSQQVFSLCEERAEMVACGEWPHDNREQVGFKLKMAR